MLLFFSPIKNVYEKVIQTSLVPLIISLIKQLWMPLI